MQMEEMTLHFDVEKAVKKNKIILTILIIAVILLALYNVIIGGDISSAKNMIERQYSEQTSELQVSIDDLAADKEKAVAEIEEYTAEIEQLKADLEAINNGTYVEE